MGRSALAGLALTSLIAVPTHRAVSAPAAPSTPADRAAQPAPTIRVPIVANDLVFDAVSDTLFASVAGESPVAANTVQPIDPDSGARGIPIAAGTEPNKLAVSDDGSYLFAGLDDASTVQRVSLATRTPDLVWSLMAGHRAFDIEAVPGDPTALAVADFASSAGGQITIYDGGVAGPVADYFGSPPFKIEFSDIVSNRLYAYGPWSSPSTVHRMEVGSTDITPLDEARGLLSGADFVHDGGLLFDGVNVVDAEGLLRVGTFPTNYAAGVVGDADAQRAYLLRYHYDQVSIDVYDTTTFLLVDSFDLGSNDAIGNSTLRPAFIGMGGERFAITTPDSVWLTDLGYYRGAAGEYTAVTPERVLDTRTGTGTDGMSGPLGPGGSLSVQLTGRGGLPASGVDAVVVNATVDSPTAASFLTVWPSGLPRPTSSNLNYTAGPTRANLVTVAVGSGGRVDVYNHDGSADVVLDVVGFYATAAGPEGGRLRPMAPQRAFDTRTGHGGVSAQPLGAAETLHFNVLGAAGVPAAGVVAVALNVTATDASASSHLTVWPDDATRPNASSLNFTAGATVPNMVTVRVPASGVVDFFNYAGSVHVVADVVGFYTLDDVGRGGRFVAFSPFRVVDSREDSPLAPPGWLPPGEGIVTGGSDEPFAAYAMNVTVTGTSGSGYLVVHPWPGEIPHASNLNYVDGQTVANFVLARTGPQIAFSNEFGYTHVVADVFGAFTSK